MTRQADGVRVAGTAVDPSSPGSAVTVDVLIDSVAVGTVRTTAGSRFDGVVPARAGTRVCVRARNIGEGANTVLGCVSRTIAVDPYGAWESITREGDKVRVKGWALDPDTTGTVFIEAYDENRVFLGTVAADKPRTDVGEPGYGANHGFEHVFAENPRDGEHQICLGMVNVGAGTHAGLGCKSYTVRHTPWGAFDHLGRGGADLHLVGWVVDDDAKTTPVTLDVFVDRELKATFPADQWREEVGQNLPEYGYHHGYDRTVPGIADLTPGTHEVCVEARNLGAGTVDAQQLGCKQYTVGAPVIAPVLADLVEDTTLTSTKVDLSWAGVPAAQSYRVERSTAGGPWETVVARTVNTRHIDSGRTPDTRYCYRVTAVNDRPSEASSELCATTLLARLPMPTGLTVVGRTDTTVTVRWTDNAVTETGYRISHNAVGGAQVWTTVPANPGTGTMTYTFTGLTANTEYVLGVYATEPGREDSPFSSVEAWTTGKPVFAELSANPQRVQACVPQSVTLTVKTVGAVRVVVKRGTTTVADKTQPTPAPWTLSIPAGSTDGASYDVVAYGVDGRTTTGAVIVHRVSDVPLVKAIRFTNTGYYKLEAWFVDINGNKLKKVGDVASGGEIVIAPEHCVLRRIQVIEPTSGRIAFNTSPAVVLGHNEGGVTQVSNG